MGKFFRKLERQSKKKWKASSGGWGSIVVSGVSCLWWDSGDKAGKTAPINGHCIPCCPFCGSVLYQYDDESKFLSGADEYEIFGHPGYKKLLLWMRGKCFKSLDEAREAMNAAQSGDREGAKNGTV